jgi:uncharacterized OB-fold protein
MAWIVVKCRRCGRVTQCKAHYCARCHINDTLTWAILTRAQSIEPRIPRKRSQEE